MLLRPMSSPELSHEAVLSKIRRCQIAHSARSTPNQYYDKGQNDEDSSIFRGCIRRRVCCGILAFLFRGIDMSTERDAIITAIDAADKWSQELDEYVIPGCADDPEQSENYEAERDTLTAALKTLEGFSDRTDNARQHWIARVKDSINGSREVQTLYFDGCEADARHYFMHTSSVIERYRSTEGDRERYQIIMAANPIVLQESQS